MKYKYPHIIENCIGEKIIFQKVETSAEGDKVIVESFCESGSGPVMHTHLQQEEELTVVSGLMGYQVLGEEPKFAKAGDTVLFKRGKPHKFWAEGSENLHCTGWLQPANSIVFFLSAVYAAQNKSGKGQPEAFGAAYLLTKYASEYDMPEIPTFVKKVIFPITSLAGRILGKYAHFKDSPEALKPKSY